MKTYTTLMLSTLGLTLIGCGAVDEPFVPDRPEQPIVASVVIKVPGMT